MKVFINKICSQLQANYVDHHEYTEWFRCDGHSRICLLESYFTHTQEEQVEQECPEPDYN